MLSPKPQRGVRQVVGTGMQSRGQGDVRIHTTDQDIELRLLEEQDASTVAAVTGRSPEGTRRWVRSLLDLEQAGKEVPCGVWVADEMAGYVLLEIHDNKEGLLHYGLVPAHRGKGIATRACAAMVGYAFSTLGLRALKIDPFADNVASCRVAERLGFAKTAIIEVPAEGGATATEARYRLTADQWRMRQRDSEVQPATPADPDSSVFH